MPSVQPGEFGVFREIADSIELGVGPTIEKDPILMRMPESLARRMDVACLIVMAMMATMTGRPPKRPLLGRRAAEYGQQELKDPTRLEGLV